MHYDPESPEVQFSADLEDIAETRFKAKLSQDADKWQKDLYAEYQAAGSPQNRRKWITDRIKNEFKSLSKPPAWVDFDSSNWPFYKDRPMVFITQIKLSGQPDAAKLIAEGFVTYFFGLQDVGKDGEVVMEYQDLTLYP